MTIFYFCEFIEPEFIVVHYLDKKSEIIIMAFRSQKTVAMIFLIENSCLNFCGFCRGVPMMPLIGLMFSLRCVIHYCFITGYNVTQEFVTFLVIALQKWQWMWRSVCDLLSKSLTLIWHKLFCNEDFLLQSDKLPTLKLAEISHEASLSIVNFLIKLFFKSSFLTIGCLVYPTSWTFILPSLKSLQHLCTYP